MNLSIIGNGFDIHSGYCTSYSNYKEYLANNSPYILNKFESFPWINPQCEMNLWKDIEATLTIDFKTMSSTINNYIMDFKNGDADAINELATDCEDWTRFIYQFTGESFYAWLSSIELNIGKKDTNINNIINNSIAVNFNYTNSVEYLYGMSTDRIMHIHGALSNVDVCSCLSHSILPDFTTPEEAESFSAPLVEKDKWNADIIRGEIQFGSPMTEETDVLLNRCFSVCEDDSTVEVLKGFITNSVKLLSHNVQKLIKFLGDHQIDEVYILGLSLNGPDDYYFEQVFLPRYSSCIWNFYYHGDEDLVQKKGFAKKYSIINTRFIEW